MILFPKHCEIPKFDRYNGKLDPIDHIKDFRNMTLEFAHEDTYLMCLFPRSLGGQSMEWLSKITSPIKKFEELINEFISQYSYNIQHQITMIDLCKAKQKIGESFITFLQRWRRLFTRYPRHVPKKEKITTFINSLDQEMSYRLNLHCPPSFQKMIENALVQRGIIKLDRDNPSSSNHHNDKSRFWTHNKNMVNDGVVDAHHVLAKPVVLSIPHNNNYNNVNSVTNQGNNSPPPLRHNQNPTLVPNQNNTNNQGYHGNNNNNALGNTSNMNPQRSSFFSNRRTFTPLGKSLESALKDLMARNVITLLPQRNFEPSVKPPSWNDAYYCEYHRCKGHRMNNFQALKNAI